MFALRLLPRAIAINNCTKHSLPHVSRHFWMSTTSTSHNSQVNNQNEQPTEQPPQGQSEQPTQVETVDKAEYDKLLEQVKLIDGKYKMSLADMENLRRRLNKELEDSKKFAVQKFCKDLIEVTDVFQLALAQIEPEAVGQSNYDGIQMIESRIRSIFSKHGLICLKPEGMKFDPNEHQALYEAPDASKEPGTISEVCKEGWKLHDRVIRPAMVGVYKKV